jgi:hypothetical protein
MWFNFFVYHTWFRPAPLANLIDACPGPGFQEIESVLCETRSIPQNPILEEKTYANISCARPCAFFLCEMHHKMATA